MADTRTLRSRLARFGLGAAVVGAAGVAIHDGLKLARIRRTAEAATELEHDALVGAGLGEPLRLVVLGDSAAAGHGITDPVDALPQRIGVQLAKASGRRVAVRSIAVSGATTSDVLRFQAPQLRDFAADVVVVNVGVNDALGRSVAKDLDEQTVALVRAVRGFVPDAHVVLVETPDLSNAPGIPFATGLLVRRRCRRVRAVQRAAAHEAGVPIVQLPDRLERVMFGDDGFHPGPNGLDAIAEQVVGELITA